MTLGDTVSTSRTKITLLGYQDQSLVYRQLGNKLEIDFPSYYQYIRACRKGCNWAYVLKMSNVKPRTRHLVKVNLKKQIKEIGIPKIGNDCNEVDCF